jgi:uncharacterized protein YunC (DUF1805 family)
LGVGIELEKAPLLVVKGKKGFLMCGYLNIKVAEKLGDAAARVTGAGTFEEMLRAEVAEVTEKARGLGIKEGITGREALERMF